MRSDLPRFAEIIVPGEDAKPSGFFQALVCEQCDRPLHDDLKHAVALDLTPFEDPTFGDRRLFCDRDCLRRWLR